MTMPGIAVLQTWLLRNKLLHWHLRWGYNNLPTWWGLTFFKLSGDLPTSRLTGDKPTFRSATQLLGNNSSNSFQTCLGKQPLPSLLGKHPQSCWGIPDLDYAGETSPELASSAGEDPHPLTLLDSADNIPEQTVAYLLQPGTKGDNLQPTRHTCPRGLHGQDTLKCTQHSKWFSNVLSFCTLLSSLHVFICNVYQKFGRFCKQNSKNKNKRAIYLNNDFYWLKMGLKRQIHQEAIPRKR